MPIIAQAMLRWNRACARLLVLDELLRVGALFVSAGLPGGSIREAFSYLASAPVLVDGLGEGQGGLRTLAGNLVAEARIDLAHDILGIGIKPIGEVTGGRIGAEGELAPRRHHRSQSRTI